MPGYASPIHLQPCATTPNIDNLDRLLGEARPFLPSVGGSDRHFPLGDQLSIVDTSLARIQPTAASSSPAPLPSPIAIDSARVIKALRRLDSYHGPAHI